MIALARRSLVFPVVAALLAAALGLLPGCGYSSGLQAPDGYTTVGVAIFSNDSKVPDLERNLHEFVAERVRDTVAAPLTTPDRADVVVQGRIIDFSRFAGTRGPDNELLESGVMIAVEAWLVDGRTGERLGSKVFAGQSVGYRIIETDGEEQSQARALSYLAEGLVLDLFARHSH